MSREAVAQALFGLVQNCAPFNTTSRLLKHWNDVPATAQPALFQTQKGETIDIVAGLPPKRLLRYDLYVYARASDKALPPSSTINILVDAIEAALAPDVSGRQTLGGLVSHAFLKGEIQTDEGVLGDQAIAIVPVEVLMP